MKTDRCTKGVLTVIALCLIWISLGGPALLRQRRLAGRRGEIWRLPITQRSPLTSTFPLERERDAGKRVAAGARLPVPHHLVTHHGSGAHPLGRPGD
jgi:hypothetical protein